MRAAIRRAFHAEADLALGQDTANFWLDLTKFYDSVSLNALMDKALSMGYPRRLLILGMQMHSAARVLRKTQCFGSCMAIT